MQVFPPRVLIIKVFGTIHILRQQRGGGVRKEAMFADVGTLQIYSF